MSTTKAWIAACFAALLPASQAAAQQELCPPAAGRGRGVVANGVSVQAPASAEDEAALLERMRSASGDERRNAILALALGGNLEAFEYLLDRRDADGLFLFGGYYFDDGGTLCLAPGIEAAILEHLHDAELRRSLLGFLGKNLYRSRELFDGLCRLVESPEEPADLRMLVMALTATNQSGLEEELLAQAVRLLPHETPVQKGLMPDVHRRFVAYFERRAEPAAIPYLQELLRVEGYAETGDYLRSKYSETRSLVYRTLDTFPSELVGEVFLEQLEVLVEAPRDVLIPYELAAFGERTVRHATSAEQKGRLSEVLSRLLEPEATDASIAYKIHDRVLDLQASIATPSAAERILAELERQVAAEGGSARALTAKAIHALAGLPVEVELDVPRFVRAASKLPERERLLLATLVLDQHPHPAGHAFYLSQLEWVLAASAETDPSFMERYWLEADSALEIVFRGLLGFDDPELLAQARDRLDAMYAQQKLELSLYLTLSRRLNQRLGDESPRFRNLLQEQERAERRTEVEKQAEWKREQQELLAAHLSAEGIAAHIQAVTTSHSREDALWLLIAGRLVLPRAHAVLRDPDASLEAKVRLLDVLGGVGHPSSAEPIIAMARAAGEPALLKDVFLVLGQLPPTQAAGDFAAEQLEQERSPIAQQSALVYLAAHRDRSALDWARRYSAPGTDPDVRAAALYLAARLGDEQALPSIVEMLEGERDRSRDEALLRALGELSTPDQFRALVPPSPDRRKTAAYRTASKLSEFGAATGADKTTLAVELIETGERWDRREVARHLLEHGQLDVLEDMLNVGPAGAYPLHMVIMSSSAAQIILVEARRLGFEIEETPEGFRLVEE